MKLIPFHPKSDQWHFYENVAKYCNADTCEFRGVRLYIGKWLPTKNVTATYRLKSDLNLRGTTRHTSCFWRRKMKVRSMSINFQHNQAWYSRIKHHQPSLIFQTEALWNTLDYPEWSVFDQWCYWWNRTALSPTNRLYRSWDQLWRKILSHSTFFETRNVAISN